MSPALHKKTLRDIRHLLKHGGLAQTFDRCVKEIDAALKPRRSVQAAKKARQSKREVRQEEWRLIRAKVQLRAMGRCEACGMQDTTGSSADHCFGGKDRKSLESIYTVWWLCLTCHRQKTDERPSRRYWLELFIEHCGKHDSEAVGHDGYLHAKEIAQARLDSLKAQSAAAFPRGGA